LCLKKITWWTMTKNAVSFEFRDNTMTAQIGTKLLLNRLNLILLKT